jgi:alkylation response protein AidB-like acyl-CoA dehydrogenase
MPPRAPDLMGIFPFEGVGSFRIELTDEQEIFRRIVEKFAEDSLRPRVKEVESRDTIPEELIEGARALGLMGVGIPPEYDGQGGGYRELAIVLEEISRVIPAFGTLLVVNKLFMDSIMLFGTEEQRRRYVPPVARGEAFAAHASTEPGAGSDVAGISTVATRSGSSWVLNGRKIFISNADRAQFFVVSARTSPPEPGKRWRGITAFVVERDRPGLRVGQKFNVMGLMGDRPNEVVLEDVEVPDSNVLGRVGDGFKIIVAAYDRSRILIAAQAVGIAQGALEAAFRYSTQREAFGKPIASFEGVSFKLAEMLAEVSAARLLTYWAASMAELEDPRVMLASSIAKYYATETAVRVARDAISIHGGVGVDRETLVERYLRDAVITTIYEGTNDIQKLTIAKSLLRIASEDLHTE